VSGRQLLGGAAVAAVLAGAVWYATRAPAGAAAPAQGLEVAVGATAEGAGSWVPYVITVKNLADGTFDGQVLLLQRAPSSSAPSPAAPLPVNRVPSAPGAPAAIVETAYATPLQVPSRTSRSVTVVAPQDYTAVEAVMDGQVLDEEQVAHAPALPVAVLTREPQAADAVGSLSYGDQQTWVTEYDTPAAVPTSPLFYAGYLTLVVDGFPTASLSAAQIAAVRQFVALGGSLLLVCGVDWQQTLAGLPSDLLPIRPLGTGQLSLLPVARLAGQGTPRTAPGMLGRLAPGARAVLTEDNGTPVAAELGLGAGRVVELAVDPSAAGLEGTALGQLAWNEALGRTFTTLPGSPPQTGAVLGPAAPFTAFLPASPQAPLPEPWLVGLVILVYVALTGPGLYLLLHRRLGRPALAWAAMPALALAFTGALYGAGNALQGGLQDAQLQVLRPTPTGGVNVLTYHKVLFSGRGQHQIAAPDAALAAPLTFDTYETTGTTCERCVNQLGSLPSGSELVLPQDRPAVQETGVIYGTVRVVGLSTTAVADRWLDTDLAERGNRIVGQVGNASPAPVAFLTLFSTDGQSLYQAELGAVVAPGQQVTVSAALSSASNPANPVQALLREVAVSELGTSGQAVLVGLTPALPSPLTVDGSHPRQTALAVLEEPVSPVQVTAPRQFEQRLLAASSPGSGGYTDVYDVVVAGATPPLRLTYTTGWFSQVEVYDFAARAYRSVPPGGGAQTTVELTPGELRDGIVRVRVSEPRVGWGENLWVDSG
jgi:hypothetical protein